MSHFFNTEGHIHVPSPLTAPLSIQHPTLHFSFTFPRKVGGWFNVAVSAHMGLWSQGPCRTKKKEKKIL